MKDMSEEQKKMLFFEEVTKGPPVDPPIPKPKSELMKGFAPNYLSKK